MKSSLETLLDDKIIENRPRKNDKSGESYYFVDNESTDKNSDSKTESETSNLDSEVNEPSTLISISSDKCVCSCHKEIEHLKSEVFSIKTFLKKEIENFKAVFSSSNNEESSSIKSVNDRLVQRLLEENKTKNDIIKILAGNLSINVNKPQSTDFSLQRPQNDIANSETSIFSEESRHKSISPIPNKPIKRNKGGTKNNRTSQYQSSSLNSKNKSINPSSNNNQNQNASSPELEPLSNTSSRQSSPKNSKTESKKDVIIIGDSMLNGINEDICDFIKPEVRKKPNIIIVHAGTNDITNNTKSFENYKKITDTIKSKLPNCKYAISNVVMRKNKPDIEKKVTEFNSGLSKICSKNKIDIIENENLDGSCLSFKKLHLNKTGNSYLANNFLDFLHSF